MSANYDDVLGQLRDAGLILDTLDTSGRMVRCKVEGEREKRGWYVLHELNTSGGDVLVVGTFGVWRGNDNGVTKVELRKRDSEFTAEQREALKRRLAEDRRRAESARRKEAERAARAATAGWAKVAPDGDSDYLAAKGGQYLARVRAVNALGAVSVPALSALTQIDGKTTPPPALTSLTAASAIFGIDLKWTFPAGATDTQRTEIWYSTTNDREAAIKLGDFAYPQATHSLMGLAAGVRFYFWGRLVDRSGNIGPWYPVGTGVVGESSSDAGPILDYLTGKIEKSQLGAGLLETIDLVDPFMAGDTLGYAGDVTRFAGVWTWIDAQQDGDQALATRIDTVAAQFDGSLSLVQTQIQTVSTQSSAAASIATQTQAQVGQVSAVVDQQSSAIANLNGTVGSSWSAKVGITADGKYYAAGFAVGIDNSSGVVQSQFLVHADLFGVLNGTGAGSTISSPFIITGGQVFIRNAFIQDGSITNAKIGDVIHSTATGAGGLPRWSLNKNGTLTMVGPNAGGGYLTVSDSVINVYDGAGTLRVRMGIW